MEDDLDHRRELRRQRREEMRLEAEKAGTEQNNDEEEAARERRRRARQERLQNMQEESSSTPTPQINSNSVESEVVSEEDQALLERLAKREERRQRRMQEAMERQKEFDPTITDSTSTPSTMKEETPAHGGGNRDTEEVSVTDAGRQKEERNEEQEERKEVKEEGEEAPTAEEVKETKEEEVKEEKKEEECLQESVEEKSMAANEERGEVRALGADRVSEEATDVEVERAGVPKTDAVGGCLVSERGTEEKPTQEENREQVEVKEKEGDVKVAKEEAEPAPPVKVSEEKAMEPKAEPAGDVPVSEKRDEGKSQIPDKAAGKPEQAKREPEVKPQDEKKVKKEPEAKLPLAKKEAEERILPSKKKEEERPLAPKKEVEEKTPKWKREAEEKSKPKSVVEEKPQEKKETEEKPKEKKEIEEKPKEKKGVEEKPKWKKEIEDKSKAKKEIEDKSKLKREEAVEEKRKGLFMRDQKDSPKQQNGALPDNSVGKLKKPDRGGVRPSEMKEQQKPASRQEAERKLGELQRRRNETETESVEKVRQKQQEAEAELEELKKKREERRKVLEEEEKQKKQALEEKKSKEEEEKRRMKEEIEQRRAEAAEKRQKESTDRGAKSPFKCVSPKGSALKIGGRAEFLNKSAQKSGTVRPTHTPLVCKIGNRLEQFTSAMQNKEVKSPRSPAVDMPVSDGVRSMKSMWEKGGVTNVTPAPAPAVPNKEAAGLNVGVPGRINKNWCAKTPETDQSAGAKAADAKPAEVNAVRGPWEKKGSAPAKRH